MAAAITTTATSLEGQLYEVAIAMQQAELAIDAASRPDNTQIGYDTENLLANITVQLPVTLSGSGGAATFTASTYLP